MGKEWEDFRSALNVAIKHSGRAKMSIAAGIGISSGALSRIINGANGPSTDTIEKILAYFGYEDMWSFLKIGRPDVCQEQNAETLAVGMQLEDDDLPPEKKKLIADARMILACGNSVAVEALTHNIRYFAHAVTLEQRVMALEKKLSVISIRKEDAA